MRANKVLCVVAVIGILAFFAPVAQAGSGGGGNPSGLPDGTGPMSCRVVDGEDLGGGISVADEYGSRDVRIGSGRLLCTSVIAITGIPPQPPPDAVSGPNALRCYSVSAIAGQGKPASPEPNLASLDDGLHSAEQTVQIGSLEYLCLPAAVRPAP